MNRFKILAIVEFLLSMIFSVNFIVNFIFVDPHWLIKIADFIAAVSWLALGCMDWNEEK